VKCFFLSQGVFITKSAQLGLSKELSHRLSSLMDVVMSANILFTQTFSNLSVVNDFLNKRNFV
jgi:hypothetical protein